MASIQLNRGELRAYFRAPLTPLLCVLLCLLCAALGGCSQRSEEARNGGGLRGSSSTSSAGGELPQHRWVFLGDSLTAGYGLAAEDAYPHLLAEAFELRGLPWKVQNAGVSGDTSAGALRRLDWLLADAPAAEGGRVHTLFICVGANDGLRGQPISALEANLVALIEQAKGRGVRVILAGMKIPTNMGAAYRARFEESYRTVAERLEVPLMPFLLEGVAGTPALNLDDGIHPNGEGHRAVATGVLRFLEAEGLL